MILALHMFGREVMVLQVGNATDSGSDGYTDDPGDCTTYPVGFHLPEMPDEVGLPDRDY